MKHKKFDEVKPYVYFIKDKKTGLKYFGARYQNFTRKKLTPNQDLGKEYFSSHEILSEKFISGFKNWRYVVSITKRCVF